MATVFRRFIRKAQEVRYQLRGVFSMLHSVLKEGQRGFDTNIQRTREQFKELSSTIADSDRIVLFQTVGLALTVWAKMEERIVAIVTILMRVDVQLAGLLMYSILNFGTWLTIVHDLFEMNETLSHHQKQWNKISERIRKIKDQRDQLAHHPIQTPDEQFTPSAVKASPYDSRRKSQRQTPMTAREVHDFIEDVVAITDDLQNLIEAMVASLQASREKSA